MPVNEHHRRFLKGLAHHAKPVVTVGQRGLTQAVIDEMEIALDRHELIKVRVQMGDRDARRQIMLEAADRAGAELIHTIGHIAVYFRANSRSPHPIVLPRD